MKFENIERMKKLVKVIILIEKMLSNDEDNHFEVLIVDVYFSVDLGWLVLVKYYRGKCLSWWRLHGTRQSHDASSYIVTEQFLNFISDEDKPTLLRPADADDADHAACWCLLLLAADVAAHACCCFLLMLLPMLATDAAPDAAHIVCLFC